jgi:ATP-dependent DNA ligase
MTSEYVRNHYQKVERLRPELGPDGTLDYRPALFMWLAKWQRVHVAVEFKIDGCMVFLFHDKEAGMTMSTKINGTYTSNDYQQLFAELAHDIRAKSAIIHGELVKKTATFYAHDILWNEGIVSPANYSARKYVLRDEVAESAHVKILKPQYLECPPNEIWVPKDGLGQKTDLALELFYNAVNLGLEGIVLKADVPYGTPNAWTKLKKHETIDAVITSKRPDEESWDIHVYNGFGQSVSIGSVASARREVDTSLLKRGSVVEIYCQEVTKEMRLRHPTILRIRDDKLQTACTTEQLSSSGMNNDHHN